MQAAFGELETKVTDFETVRPQLAPDLPAGTFLDIVQRLEAIGHLTHRIYGYAGLWFAEDTQNQAAQAFMGRVDQFMAGIGNRTLFFSLWWKGLEDDAAERLMAEAGDYRYWLEEMRHFKPHTLSEPEEKIINIKDVTGVNALQTLYDSITNRYTFKLEVEGEVKEMTRDELSVYIHHHDPTLRA